MGINCGLKWIVDGKTKNMFFFTKWPKLWYDTIDVLDNDELKSKGTQKMQQKLLPALVFLLI